MVIHGPTAELFLMTLLEMFKYQWEQKDIPNTFPFLVKIISHSVTPYVSERELMAANKIFTKDRALLATSTLEDIIIIRFHKHTKYSDS